VINAINKAIYQKLAGASAVTSQLSGGSAIYYHQAPTGAVLPYIVYIFAGGGSDNSDPLDSGDVMYYVKAIARTAQTAGAIADAIRSTLHEQSVTIDSPWSVYRCQHNEVLTLVEDVEREQFYHAGGSYRIRFSL